MAEKGKKKQVGNNSSGGSKNSNKNSSFTNDLFGPKDPPSPSSSTLFGSVFGPPSSMGKQDFGGHYVSGNITHNSKGGSSKDKNNKYDNQTVEPCYLSSSIYYGGQEVYPPNSQPNASQSVFKKDGTDGGGPNGSDSASRGNWWKGSLYY